MAVSYARKIVNTVLRYTKIIAKIGSFIRKDLFPEKIQVFC
jgi:hypothetical protein